MKQEQRLKQKIAELEAELAVLTPVLYRKYKWLTWASTTLSLVNVDLMETSSFSASRLVKIRLAAWFYLKHLLRSLFYFIELFIYRLSIRPKAIAQRGEKIIVFETFLMAERIFNGDFSDDFVSKFSWPENKKTVLFGSVFGGRAHHSISRVKAALRAKNIKGAINQYDILRFRDVILGLFLSIRYLFFLFDLEKSLAKRIRHGCPGAIALHRRVLQEFRENKLDIILRRKTGERLVRALDVDKLVSWSENQPWHRVFFSGCLSSNCEQNQIFAYEFFNINHNSLYTRYTQPILGMPFPGTVFVKGQYWLNGHTHPNTIDIGCFREAELKNLFFRSVDKNTARVLGVALPYSLDITFKMIDLAVQIHETLGMSVLFRVHPNNVGHAAVENKLSGLERCDRGKVDFYNAVDAVLTEGSGLALEAVAIGLATYVYGDKHFQHPLPFEQLGRSWFFLNENNFACLLSDASFSTRQRIFDKLFSVKAPFFLDR